jgi:hypothetical protein
VQYGFLEMINNQIFKTLRIQDFLMLAKTVGIYVDRKNERYNIHFLNYEVKLNNG